MCEIYIICSVKMSYCYVVCASAAQILFHSANVTMSQRSLRIASTVSMQLKATQSTHANQLCKKELSYIGSNYHITDQIFTTPLLFCDIGDWLKTMITPFHMITFLNVRYMIDATDIRLDETHQSKEYTEVQT